MVEIKNLDFSYKKTPVFHNITMELKPGNIYGLLGENGVGKTTLLKLISGLQKPCKGTCRVDGADSVDRQPSFLENIIFLPDSKRRRSPRNLFTMIPLMRARSSGAWSMMLP